MAGNENSGRPPFEPTDEQREKVQVLKACGLSNVAIAEALEISEPTLTKHFRLEIDLGSARTRANLLMARYSSAIKGNVSAQNRMLEQVAMVEAKNRMSGAPAQADPEKPAEKPTAPVKQGKKAQQLEAAKAAAKTPRLRPRQGPKLSVVK